MWRIYCSILPWAYDDLGQVQLLLGQEASDGTWSCFGGGPDGKETDVEAAAREAYEESMGLLGTIKELKQLLNTANQINSPVQRISLENDKVVIFLVQMEYDQVLPANFNRVYDYLRPCLVVDSTHNYPYLPSSPSGLMEKSAMAWISIEEVSLWPLRSPFRVSLEHILKVIKLPYEELIKD